MDCSWRRAEHTSTESALLWFGCHVRAPCPLSIPRPASAACCCYLLQLQSDWQMGCAQCFTALHTAAASWFMAPADCSTLITPDCSTLITITTRVCMLLLLQRSEWVGSAQCVTCCGRQLIHDFTAPDCSALITTACTHVLGTRNSTSQTGHKARDKAIICFTVFNTPSTWPHGTAPRIGMASNWAVNGIGPGLGYTWDQLTPTPFMGIDSHHTLTPLPSTHAY